MGCSNHSHGHSYQTAFYPVRITRRVDECIVSRVRISRGQRKSCSTTLPELYGSLVFLDNPLLGLRLWAWMPTRATYIFNKGHDRNCTLQGALLPPCSLFSYRILPTRHHPPVHSLSESQPTSLRTIGTESSASRSTLDSIDYPASLAALHLMDRVPGF